MWRFQAPPEGKSLENLYAEAVIDELVRLNDNFERYLRFLKVPMGTEEEKKESVFVRLPLSEFEQAIKEHAELMGAENVQE